MMEPPRIRKLPEKVISRIAAGEVVESPSAVVKELLENAVDSGASRVTLEVRGNGWELIRVTDDGVGIAREDAELVFERYTTSKITSEDDLYGLSSMGFRGEALFSISSVSRIEIVTRRKQDEAAFRLAKEPDGPLSVEAAGRNPGTTVSVMDLFFNVPARRKFMKAESTEMNRVTHVFTAIATANPSITFRHVVDDKEKLNLPATDDPLIRIRGVYGAALADALIRSEYNDDTCRILAWFSNLDYTRNNRTGQVYFVNRRCIENRGLDQGIRIGYRDLLPPGRFPAAIVFVTINPEEIDVNVHPTKREIRFSNEQQVVRGIARCITEGFRGLSVTPNLSPNVPASWDGNDASAAVPPAPGPQDALPQDFLESLPPPPDKSSSGEEEPGRNMLISYYQIHNTYILSQIKNGIVLIDQHVAHERILYERAIKNIESQEQAVVQQLLFPVTIELSPVQRGALEQYADFFRKTGFSVSLFSGNTAVVDGIPAGLRDCPVQAVVMDMLDNLAGGSRDATALHASFARSFACQAALKAGTQLSIEEINNLVDLLFQCENPYTCPHGRPIIVRLTLEEIGRRFMRS